MCDIEGLHPLLREQKQHGQCGATWSETKPVIQHEVVGEKEGSHINCDDGFHDLADDWKQADVSAVEGIRFFTFL